MLSLSIELYIEQQIKIALSPSVDLAAEMAFSRAVGAIDLLHIQGHIDASEYLARHAIIKKAREQRFSLLREAVEVHQV